MATAMPQLEQLKEKYRRVFDTMSTFDVEVLDVHVAGGKLFLKVLAPSELVKNRIWDTIKQVDPTYADLAHDIQAKGAEHMYTIKPGDTLSKISKHFYGDAGKYMKIAQANNIADSNKIQAGATIVIPV